MAAPDPEAYQAILRRGRPALAWEVLRRSPAYCAAYAALSPRPSRGFAGPDEFAKLWGLHFR